MKPFPNKTIYVKKSSLLIHNAFKSSQWLVWKYSFYSDRMEFGFDGFWREGKSRVPREKTSRCRRETPLIYFVDAGTWIGKNCVECWKYKMFPRSQKPTVQGATNFCQLRHKLSFKPLRFNSKSLSLENAIGFYRSLDNDMHLWLSLRLKIFLIFSTERNLLEN